MRSLRLRIAAAVALGQFVLLALATAFAYRAGARALTGQFDESLRARAAAYESLIEQEGTRVHLDPREARALAPPPGEPRELVQVWAAGRRVYRSVELEDEDLPKPGDAVGTISIEDSLVGGRPVRLLSMRVPVNDVERTLWSSGQPEPEVITLVIARERRALDGARSGLLRALLGGAFVLLASSVLLAWWVAGRGLDPLRAFGRRVGALDVATLGGRFERAEHPREVEPVVDGLNDLRERIDAALRREKRVNATLAHELRTPIAELRTMTAVALRDPGDARFTLRALEQVHRVSGRLGELVELLRELARLEQGGGELPAEDVDLGELVGELVAPLGEEARARGLRIELRGLDGARVRANRAALASVCSNLLANAVQHAPEGSEVRCGARRADGALVLAVENPCADLTPDQVERLTEPFWRGSVDRADPDRHGLGLAIASGLARLAGLWLDLDVEDGVFVAELTIPTA